jgi:hypothetical protein
MDEKLLFAEIERLFGGTEVLEICRLLAQSVLDLDRQAANHLTFQSFVNLAAADELDARILAAVNFLTTSKFSILEPHAVFVGEDGEEYDLPDDELHSALESGTLAHPETGQIVGNVSAHIAPYFSRRTHIIGRPSE